MKIFGSNEQTNKQSKENVPNRKRQNSVGKYEWNHTNFDPSRRVWATYQIMSSDRIIDLEEPFQFDRFVCLVMEILSLKEPKINMDVVVQLQQMKIFRTLQLDLI